ncbi:hypothetical protein GCM10009764_79270 [Nocardia ninae]
MLRSTRAIPERPGSVSVFLDNNASIFMDPMLHANPKPLVEARRTTYHIHHCDNTDTTRDTRENSLQGAVCVGHHIHTFSSRA